MDATDGQDGLARRAGRAVGRTAWAGARAGGRLAGSALSRVPEQAPEAPRPHAVLPPEAHARALADLARAAGGEPVEQGRVPDPVAFSWPRRVRPYDPEDETPDGVVDLVAPDDHGRLLGAVLVGLTKKDLRARPLGERLLSFAGEVLDTTELPNDEFRRYAALVDPEGRLVARAAYELLVPGVSGSRRLRDAAGEVLLETVVDGRVRWQWADGEPGPTAPVPGFATDPDLRAPGRLSRRRLTTTVRPDAPGLPFWTVSLTEHVPPGRRDGVQALRLLPAHGTGFVGRV